MKKELLAIAAVLILSACASTDHEQSKTAEEIAAETEKWLNDPEFADDDGSGK